MRGGVMKFLFNLIFGTLGLLTILAGGIFLLAYNSAPTSVHGETLPKTAPTLPSVCKNDGMAFVMSQKFVKRDLKSPSTASFPYKPIASSSLGECKFRIKAYVDSQNGFGATIRSNYLIDMEYLPSNKNWRGSNLQIQ